MQPNFLRPSAPSAKYFAANHRKETNVLLVKDDVGRSKPYTRPLPSETFKYGDPVIHDLEHAPEGNSHFSPNCSYEQLAIPLQVYRWNPRQGLQKTKQERCLRSGHHMPGKYFKNTIILKDQSKFRQT
jgi:hypothetical protein